MTLRIGIAVGGAVGGGESVPNTVEQVRDAARRGFATVWATQTFGLDALTTLAVAGAAVPLIELGTAVVPTYPRHPMMLASQAMTVQSATGNRLVLGIGLSHQLVIEGMFGYSFDKPARHMREYLSILQPLLRDGSVQFTGETLKANGTVTVAEATPPAVLLAALAPRMLQLAGAEADGTITWMTGPATLGDHIVPSITAAATAAGRPAPRIAVGLPVSVTADPDAARAKAASTFQIYGQLPSYRAMLDREGAEGPADVAIVGDEGRVSAQIAALADQGATDFMAAPFGSSEDRARTVDVLAGLAGGG
jgi:5,10-methylenetetrahydromethanopterin reductase